MALNFPDSPSTNEYFTDNTSGFSYQWNGVVWISVASTQTTSLKEFDDISGSFNSSTTTFSLTFGAGSTKVYPLSVNQITIVIGGILQNAGDDYTVSGDQITFTTPPDAGLTFQGMFYGSSVSMNSAAAGSIGTAAFSTGGPIWNIGGDVTVAGIVTVGSSSVVIDGPSNEIRVGTGATVNASGIVIGGAGIVTASYFYGDGSGLDGIVSGIGSTGSINTSGIITASTFSGSGSGLSNIGGQLSAITYSPGIGATGVAAASNIVITFNKPVKANTGTITLKEGAADGSTVESFDVETSDKITISGGQITIDPTSNFGATTSFYVAVPAGAYKDILNTSSSLGISTYSFQTAGTAYELWAVGMDLYGNLAQNTQSENRSSPVQIPGTNWSTKAGGSNTIENNNRAVIKSDGTLWVWGYGGNGGNGLNDAISRSSPTQVPGTQWSSLSNWGTKLATKTDGTLWGWGANGNGRLGLNDIIDRSSPIQIPGTQWGTSTKQSSQGNDHCGNIKTDGTLWVIGNNGDGQLGLNDVAKRSSPTQVPGTYWNKICSGQQHSLASKTDGTLWAWGDDNNGQLGLNAYNVLRSSPTQIPGTQWDSDSIDCSIYGSSALKTDGTLWVWGKNDYGNLGLNDGNSRSSPVQLPGTQWTIVNGSLYYRAFLKSDGTAWATGWNTNGGLGQNDVVHRSSPVQIPGTQWISISKAYQSLQLWKEV